MFILFMCAHVRYYFGSYMLTTITDVFYYISTFLCVFAVIFIFLHISESDHQAEPNEIDSNLISPLKYSPDKYQNFSGKYQNVYFRI